MRLWPTPFRCFCARAFATALAVALLLGTLCQTQAADPAPKRILMLHSFGPRFKPWSDYEQSIRSEISRRWQKRVEFLDQSLVNAGDGENPEPAFVDYLRALYARRPIDLIVAMGAPAADFIQRHRQQLFPTTPMVFTAVEQRRVQSEKLTENDTVVAVAHDFPAALDNILRVLPLTQTIAVVNGASPNEKFWLEEMRRELAPLTRRIELRWYDELSFEDILLEAARLAHAIDLSGAWATNADQCSEVFIRKGKANQIGFTALSEQHGGGFFVEADRLRGNSPNARSRT